MKKLTLILMVLFFGSMSMHAQSIKSYLEDLDDKDEYSIVTINKEMFKMIASFEIDFGEDEDAIKDLINDINKVRIFINEEAPDASDYKALKNIAGNTSMDHLISVKDGSERVDLYTNPTSDDSIVEGLLLLVKEESQNVFIHMDGKINLKTLGMLTEKLDIDGLEHLKKIK